MRHKNQKGTESVTHTKTIYKVSAASPSLSSCRRRRRRRPFTPIGALMDTRTKKTRIRRDFFYQEGEEDDSSFLHRRAGGEDPTGNTVSNSGTRTIMTVLFMFVLGLALGFFTVLAMEATTASSTDRDIFHHPDTTAFPMQSPSSGPTVPLVVNFTTLPLTEYRPMTTAATTPTGTANEAQLPLVSHVVLPNDMNGVMTKLCTCMPFYPPP